MTLDWREALARGLASSAAQKLAMERIELLERRVDDLELEKEGMVIHIDDMEAKVKRFTAEEVSEHARQLRLHRGESR